MPTMIDAPVVTAGSALAATLAVLQTLGVPIARSLRGGREFVVLCPLHSERTPSMHVYDDGRAKCYGCDAYCSSAKYLWLAAQYGPRSTYAAAEYRSWDEIATQRGLTNTPARLTLPAHRRQEPASEVRAAITALFRWGQQFLDAPEAMRYWCTQRKLTPATACRYLSYLPLNATIPTQYVPALKAIGAWYDASRISPMQGRLLMGTYNADDELAYFQGRLIGSEAGPRYLSPRAWSAVPTLLEGRSHTVHIVEGLIDALSLHQFDASVLMFYGCGNLRYGAVTLQLLASLGRPLVLWPDNDPQRNAMAPSSTQMLERLREYVQRPVGMQPTPEPGCKEVNDWLANAPQSLAATIAHYR